MTEEEYKKELKLIEENFEKAKQSLVLIFVKSNAKYKHGDILEDYSSVIKVEVVRSYRWNSWDVPKVSYYGPELRKRDHQPKVSGDKSVIQEDYVIKKHN
jgi:hypothetical protein